MKHKTGNQRKSLAKFAISLTSTLAVCLGAAAAFADDLPKDNQQNLDERLTQLQSTRDCINAAKTKEGVDACRKKLKDRGQDLKPDKKLDVKD